MKHVNKVGPSVLGPLGSVHEAKISEIAPRLTEAGFVVLDTRSRDAFLESHLRGSLFTPLEKFTDFAGSYLSPAQEIVLVAKNGEEAADLRDQLIRIGFDKVIGTITPDAIATAPTELKSSIRAVKFPDVPSILGDGSKPDLLDVRKATEFAPGHIEGARNLAHTRLLPRLAEIPSGPLLVSCQSGMRAAGACAFLSRNGRNVTCIADKFENAPKELLT